MIKIEDVTITPVVFNQASVGIIKYKITRSSPIPTVTVIQVRRIAKKRPMLVHCKKAAQRPPQTRAKIKAIVIIWLSFSPIVVNLPYTDNVAR